MYGWQRGELQIWSGSEKVKVMDYGWEVQVWNPSGSMCYALEQDTYMYLSQCFSPPRSKMGTCELLRKLGKKLGSNLAMD